MDTLSEARSSLTPEGRSLLFTDARTASFFAPTPVTDEELREIWELAKWPPTQANTQPLRVLFVRTADGRERLIKHLAEGNRAKSQSAPVVAVLALDTEFHEHVPQVFPHNPGLKNLFEGNVDKRIADGTFSAALQAGYFIIAARAVGLHAGPMTGFDKAGVDAEFFPDGRFRSLAVVNLGHPAENAYRDRLPRLDHETTLHWA
ncbi:malonic semialdehyde reductase [Actinoplanes sp. SE50]|uniref:malonic semialdehyde reductase n=1 Tax=unclassified Actinoplanes TaxID=2626549 RepID=UPI00023EE0DA|nr:MULTISPECIES: malonic semialdehyde reductase [unclassified Actinoplanes]AEV89050.1 Nitroreductase [Actinoplanes sp. SE50/110]ATO87456.1 malonic semialdehyde reductase [Actinoplanes sp. SE50]SLM04874.1 nitroreductase family protein [Actinoplanes sp. SE50/110]